MRAPMEVLKAPAGFRMTQIPCTGAGLAIVALLAGQVNAIASGASTFVPQIQPGRGACRHRQALARVAFHTGQTAGGRVRRIVLDAVQMPIVRFTQLSGSHCSARASSHLSPPLRIATPITPSSTAKPWRTRSMRVSTQSRAFAKPRRDA